MEQSLILLGGVPGAGKSTWLELNKDLGEVVVFDDFVRKIHQQSPQVLAFEIAQQAKKESWAEVFVYLQQGKSVYYDTPNLTKNQRLEIFESLTMLTVKVHGIWKEISFDQALERNKNREFCVSLENQILFHCLAQPFELSEGFCSLECENIVPSSLAQEVKKFLETGKNSGSILQFPEFHNALESLAFFDISLKSILKDETQSPQQRLIKAYKILKDFYVSQFQYNPYGIFIQPGMDVHQSFIQRIIANRCGNDFVQNFLHQS